MKQAFSSCLNTWLTVRSSGWSSPVQLAGIKMHLMVIEVCYHTFVQRKRQKEQEQNDPSLSPIFLWWTAHKGQEQSL